MQPSSNILSVFLLTVSLTIGCSDAPAPATGGTPGTLTFGDGVTSDINITVHRSSAGSFQPIGFGLTDLEGKFILYQTGAAGPLWLEPGDYVFTLESVGPSIAFPKEYLNPQSTPLKLSWTADSTSADLTVSQKLLGSK
ncbi:MAG: hypothetical protein U0936_06160 [Planctomycetaceae bacterium]